jgi:hypothetical protein
LTIAISLLTPHSIWLACDRRLTRSGRPPNDTARKATILETIDGVALLGYAGLGATMLGTEPADWMAATLRGVNAPLEQCLKVLADAAARRLPPHLATLPSGHPAAHHILIPAFLHDKPKLYTIEVELNKQRSASRHRFMHWLTPPQKDGVQRTPRFGLAGSGVTTLIATTRWHRPVLRLVKSVERGKADARVVADELARLCLSVHRRDTTVGPSSLVLWRFNKDSPSKGGGGFQFFMDGNRIRENASIPTVVSGMDLNAFIGILLPEFLASFEAFKRGDQGQGLDRDRINEKLAELPDEPDDTLQ